MTAAELAIIIRARDQARGVLNGLSGLLRGIGSAAASSVRGVGSLTSALGQLGLAGLGIQQLVGIVKSLGGALGLDLNASLEDTTARFVAFTKDVGLARSIVAQLRAEADKTPFAFDAMAEAGASLLPIVKATGADFMELIRLGEILAASNPAEGLTGAAFSLREALSGDFTSIVERFNLPRTMINQLKEQGVPNLEIVRRAMRAMGLDMDLVGNLAQTARGRLSTLLDALNGLRQRASQPLFEMLSSSLASLQGFLDRNRDTLNRWADVLGGMLVQAALFARDVIRDLTRAFVDLEASDITSFLQDAASVANNLMNAYRGLPEPVKQAVAQFGALAAVLLVVAPVVALLTPLIGALLSPVGAVIAIVGTLAIVWQNNWLGIRDTVAQILPPLGEFILRVVSAIVGFFQVNLPKIAQIVQIVLTFVAGLWQQHSGTISNIVTTVLSFLEEEFGRRLEAVSNIVDAVLQALQGNWKGAFQSLLRATAASMEGLARLVGEGFKIILRGATGFARFMANLHGGLARTFGLPDRSGDLLSEIDRFESEAFSAIDTAANLRARAEEAIAAMGDATSQPFRFRDAQESGRASIVDLANTIRNLLTPGLDGATDQWKVMEDAMRGGVPTLNTGNFALQQMGANATSAKDAIALLSDRLQDAKQRLQDLSRPQLVGMGQLDERLFQVQQELNRRELRRLARQFPQLGIQIPEPLTEEGRQFVGTLPRSTSRLRRLQRALELQQEVQFGEQLRLIQQAAEGPRPEITFTEALQQIATTKAEIAALEPAIAALRAASEKQKDAAAQQILAAQALNRASDSLATRMQEAARIANSVPQSAMAPTFNFAAGAIQVRGTNVTEGQVRETVTSSLTGLVASSSRSSGLPARRTLPGVM